MRFSCRLPGRAAIPVCCLLVCFFATGESLATQPDDESGEAADSSGIVLPSWGPGDYQGNFPVGIWPDQVHAWLERENLRALIRDPDLPEAERAKLKRIFAMQMAFAPREDRADKEG